jgi:hypothetical protein
VFLIGLYEEIRRVTEQPVDWHVSSPDLGLAALGAKVLTCPLTWDVPS